jgi:hypothetical protein
MDLEEVGWGDVYWIGLVRDRNRWRAPSRAGLANLIHIEVQI